MISKCLDYSACCVSHSAVFGEEDDIEELEQQLDQLTLSEKLNVSTSK